MGSFIISTDRTCDFPAEYITQNEILYFPMIYTMDGVEYGTPGGPDLPGDEFYQKLAAGSLPVTSQITPSEAFNALEPYAKEGAPVLHIAFSSALSGTYNSFVIAAGDLKEKYPQSNIRVIDSVSASLGEGLLVDYAVRLRAEGKTLEETAALIEENKRHFCHFFTVNDLFHLQRGGRVSKFTAVVGSMLGIKPILHVDDEGRLIPIGKVRGRKASMEKLVNAAAEKIVVERTPHFYVSHGGCYEEAEQVAKALSAKTGIKDYMIHMIGPIIGSHSGCGTIAVFFWGTDRNPV